MTRTARRPRLVLIAGATIALVSLAGCSRFQQERANIRYNEVAIQAEATDADVVMVDP